MQLINEVKQLNVESHISLKQCKFSTIIEIRDSSSQEA